MSQSDYVGLGGSVLVHVLLALLFGVVTASSPQPQQLGYVEVEFGEFAAGQPVEAVDEATEPAQEDVEERPEPPEETQSEPEPVTEPEPEPVDVPDEEPPAEETVAETEDTETVPPQTDAPQDEQTADAQEPSDDPGDAETGDPGTGATEQRSAPYNIEGLDRDPVFAPLPGYVEQVNTRISFRITVAPSGRVISAIPARKGGSPDLENEVQRTLLNWKFNALPTGAPQNAQRGVVTFTFRLE